MSEITIVATITPAEGKVDRVQELLTEMTQTVHAKEPNVLRYQLHRQTDAEGTPVFIMLETYKDSEALNGHLGSEAFQNLGQTFQKEGLVAKGLEIVKCEPVGGFASRL
ncbi:hypothetical protein BDV97DRAFT_400113 [Delphinella strobiligena]|nr:hypothetical protein BDV97DRAFT_400113 [Delphinella strobiligena]